MFWPTHGFWREEVSWKRSMKGETRADPATNVEAVETTSARAKILEGDIATTMNNE